MLVIILACIFYVAINVVCVSVCVASTTNSGQKAAAMSIINLIPLLRSPRLDLIMEILGLSIKTNSETHKTMITINRTIASKSTSRKRTGSSKEALIENLMAMDSMSTADLEDKAKDLLSAI
ncbi:hypothetical protein BTUL_0065g00310 [Botrytis tulipae]|uniref:Uncharacterized protein n=1 Tax=Botrytis tulipae TaxID=87230 RepID=A0A4Z1EMU6_9HELO|nr:hypothetical protein BTUL_0065g00310 [Botrytis tulipae]